MLRTIVKKGSYRDSVVLMLLSNELSKLDGVKKISVMMATPANKDILKESGLETEELMKSSANDMVVIAEIDDESKISEIQEALENYLNKNNEDKDSDKSGTKRVKSWDKALSANPDANLAVISIPGAYAAIEANKALDKGLNVFMFSDNVTIEDELQLKSKAHKKGLSVMGPDCGTGIIHGVPIAFTNNVSKGEIGIIGASGTGIQELTTIIDRAGFGVTNAIGTGGRDLKEQIGGITMLDMIDAMENNDETKVLIVISKPPAESVRIKISERLKNISKPVVTLFLGEKPEYHEEGFYHAYTLQEAADIAISLVKGEKPSIKPSVKFPETVFSKEEGKTIKAYYSGGTLAHEAAVLIKDALSIGAGAKQEGYMLNSDGNVVIDLGDDIYTQGKPHPMIDPEKRIECMENAVKDPSTGVILFDIMLGYGSHEDMAGALLPAILKLKEEAASQKRNVVFVSTVCGTDKDYQGYDKAVKLLSDNGVVVLETNKQAALYAIRTIGYDLVEKEKEIKPVSKGEVILSKPSKKLEKLLSDKPKAINIGLESFAKVLSEFGCEVVQFDWAPPAGGNIELLKMLNFINSQENVDIEEENEKVIEKILSSQPVLIDNRRAKELIGEINEGKVLLHAGPPVEYKNMPDPMKGSCVGAVLFEEWAADEASARRMLENGEIKFIPCHHVNAVGPMGGITSPNMPLFVVKNETEGNVAYCTMNEGIGKVLRFGAYSEEVIERLRWMRDVLGPVLATAIKARGGLSLNPLIAKAIAMGDEFHQRNIAASLVFLKEMAPVITQLDIEDEKKKEVITFLADTDQFFLNIMMAFGKSVMDSARKDTDGTIVTAMCRNGYEFGIRIAGMGDEWFTGPVNTPQGLYFTGYTKDDACSDMGDSAITETFGVGGMAMIAAPAVTRFVGTGGFEDAVNISNEMMEICATRNPNFVIPNWNFQGICTGIDARLVVEKQITPVINTGIAHKIAGFGQIGAGTVHPPIECFEKAIKAYAEKLGYLKK